MSKLNAVINPQLELMNSLLLTSKYNEITKPIIGDGLMSESNTPYIAAIKEHFLPYADHSVYSLIEQMIPDGFTFSRPVELALSLDDNLKVVRQLSNMCIEYCGGQNRINELLELIKDIGHKVDYMNFYNKHKDFYASYLNELNSKIKPISIVNTIESFYGKGQRSYNLVLSSLMTGCFGLVFHNKDETGDDVFSVLSINNLHSDIALLLHELSHPFVNPLTEKYRTEVEKYSAAYEYLKQYKLHGFRSGYGDWEECVNEHLVRTSTIHMLNKLGFMDLAEKNLSNDLNSGYRFIPALLQAFDHYENNRDRYKTFDLFYAELIQRFQLNLEEKNL